MSGAVLRGVNVYVLSACVYVCVYVCISVCANIPGWTAVHKLSALSPRFLMRLRLTLRPRIILSRRINVTYFLHRYCRFSYEPLMSRVLRSASLNFAIVKMTTSCSRATHYCSRSLVHEKCDGCSYARTRDAQRKRITLCNIS